MDLTDNIQPGDSASTISRQSRGSNIELLRIAEEQKRAELTARSAAIEQMHAIELSRRSLEMENQRLMQQIELSRLKIEKQARQMKLQMEIDASIARLQVLEKYESEPPQYNRPSTADVNDPPPSLDGPFTEPVADEGSPNDGKYHPETVICDTYDMMEDYYVPPTLPVPPPTHPAPPPIHPAPPPIHPAPPPAPMDVDPMVSSPSVPSTVAAPPGSASCTVMSVPCKQNPTDTNVVARNDVASAITALADALKDREEKLPKKEPDVFKGNVFDFAVWMNSFSVLVEKRYSSAVDRLYYLGKYTSGEARECIKGLLALNNDGAYQKAKKLLTERYGNKLLAANTYREKINKWPTVKQDDGKGLRNLSDFLFQCETAMKTLSQLKVLDDPAEHKKIIEKLPRHVQNRWLRFVDQWMYDKQGIEQDDYPPFSELCKFVAREARIACSPFHQKPGQERREDNKMSKPSGTARAFASKAEEMHVPKRKKGLQNVGSSSWANSTPKCPMCKGQHQLESCSSFGVMSLSERQDFIKKNGLCFGCLRWGHRRQDCRNKKQCDNCGRYHPTILHDYSRSTPEVKDEKKKEVVTVESTTHRVQSLYTGDVSCTLIVPVVLHHQRDPNTKVIVYALLDEHSDACFISDATVERLHIDGEKVQLNLSTILAKGTISSRKVYGLTVKGLCEDTEIELPATYSRESINANRQQIPRSDTVKEWPHLKCVANLLPPYLSETEIGLLIGCNVTRAIKPREVVHGKEDDPYALRTVLGWGVVGKMHRGSNDGNAHGFSASSQESRPHFAFRTQVKEVSPLRVAQMFEVEFNERDSDEKISLADRRFMQKVTEGIHKREDGHFEMPLPFKTDDVRLPNNKPMALRRLSKLKTKMLGNSNYRDDYKTFMEDILKKGYAESVPEDELDLNDGKVWYIPHHGIYHPKKPAKIRIVFDCSAEYEGEVLNRHLLQGPDMINSLAGVLCRFRKDYIAFTCDIEGMFHQVGVNVEDRNYLRFLWWQGGEMQRSPSEYRMKVHLFGATSSPACANFALKCAADVDEGTAAADFVKNDFYVDDGLTSVSSTEEALKLIEGSRQLCERSGFHLHKFISNDKTVLQAIPPSERAKNVQSVDVFSEGLPIERTLGVQWCVESDTFQFRVHFNDKPLTRRGIMSSVSSIFDPLGLVSPVLLVGKQILQSLCRDGYGWDDPVSEGVRAEWEKWRCDVHHLATLKVPRCYKPPNFGVTKSAELHHFSDASVEGYGQCSYLRLIDERGRVGTTLVMGKSRVTPSKPVTIPRLELMAAVTSVQVGTYVAKELQYEDITHVFYTDSRVVLGYIANDSKRFHIFVANRVQKIRDHTTPEDWRHINTKINPADPASRGVSAETLIHSKLWWNGPDFLKTTETPPPEEGPVELSSTDPEVKASLSVFNAQAEVPCFPSMLERFEYFSTWFRLRRAVAVCLRFLKKLKDRTTKRRSIYTSVTVFELQQAEQCILRIVQQQAFPKEIRALSKGDGSGGDKQQQTRHYLGRGSSLCTIDPFIDDNKLLRVGGRINQAPFAEEIKHPILVPRRSHVTDLLIEHYHVQSCHSGRGMTLNSIRQAGYWILGARAAVTSHIWKCVTCRKLRGKSCGQKMAELPRDRLDPSPPFTYSAVDFFGPFVIKEGRREQKRWGVIFSCMASRAVHIEIAASLSTDSFLSAYRRFTCRRGPVRQLRSDRGTNFVGGKNELENALAEMDQLKISQELLKDSCDWVMFNMNVPAASHMAGAWERMIRSIRNALSALLQKNGQQLDDELLRTLMVEAEAVVNSRPLTYVDTTTPDAPEPLSPSQLLTLKAKVVLPPPGVFVPQDLYSRRRWRRAQYLANQFWSRWKTEYLSTLQERKKWMKPQKNLEKGDIVLMIDDTAPRCQWKLARVVETCPSSDGHVRKVRLQTGRSTFERPVHKVVLLLDRGHPDEEPKDTA